MPDRKLFNRIAAVYSRFFAFQQRMYENALHAVAPHISLDAYETLLDVGCGTGAFASVMLDRGFRVTGIDTAKKMVAVAERKVTHPHACFVVGDGKTLPFPDASFDIVFSSYVLHGLKTPERLKLYEEMKRVAKHLVIVHDYSKKRNLFTSLVEWAERGDYFTFIRVVEEEMQEVFPDFSVIPVGDKANWYVGRV